jgi:hypothetical protein
VNDVLEQGKGEALLSLQTARLEERTRKGNLSAKRAPKTVLEAASEEFEALWASLEGRLALVDAKLAIRAMNTVLQLRNARTLNVHSLARALPPVDVSPEVREILETLEDLILRSRGNRSRLSLVLAVLRIDGAR